MPRCTAAQTRSVPSAALRSPHKTAIERSPGGGGGGGGVGAPFSTPPPPGGGALLSGHAQATRSRGTGQGPERSLKNMKVAVLKAARRGGGSKGIVCPPFLIKIALQFWPGNGQKPVPDSSGTAAQAAVAAAAAYRVSAQVEGRARARASAPAKKKPPAREAKAVGSGRGGGGGSPPAER